MRYNYFILIILLLVGWSDGFAQVNSVAKPKKIILVLDWFINPNHAPIFVAQQQGFFKEKGLTVEIITPADPADPPKWVAMGRADITIDYQPQLLLSQARGLPLEQIGTLIDHPLCCLTVLANSKIKNLQQLRGQTIAYSSPGDALILDTMLGYVHLKPSDVKVINVHYDLTQALLTGRVTAAMGMMRNYEPLQLELLGKATRTFLPEHYGFPSYSELVFVAKVAAAPDPRYINFFQALEQGKRYLLAHPEITWRDFIKTNPQMDTPLNKRVWQNNLTQFPATFQGINTKQCLNLRLFLMKKRQITIELKNCHTRYSEKS